MGARGFPPGAGYPKTGGRKRGTPNKRTRELLEVLEELGYCPIRSAIEVAEIAKKEYDRADVIYDAICDGKANQGSRTPTQDMAPQYLKIMQDSAAIVAPFVYPKRKAVEFNDPNGTAANTLTEIFKRIANSG